MNTNRPLPFGMLEKTTNDGCETYGVYPEHWTYDPDTQVSDMITRGGPSEPTTRSLVAGTTGFFNDDSDEGNDDKGQD